MKRRKPGRPSLYSPQKRKEICGYIALGMTRENAALLAGISEGTFYDWQKAYPEFLQQVQAAEAKCQARCLSNINKAGLPKFHDRERTKTRVVPVMRGKKLVHRAEMVEKVTEHLKKEEGEWQASAWLLERRWPQHFGRVDRHLIGVTGKGGGPLAEDLVAAIGRALGVTEKLEPIGNLPASTEPAIDVDILPQD